MAFYRALLFNKDSQVAFHVMTVDTLHLLLCSVGRSMDTQLFCTYIRGLEF